eukprot:4126443-Alexandrium_andersonii.AAC.1
MSVFPQGALNKRTFSSRSFRASRPIPFAVRSQTVLANTLARPSNCSKARSRERDTKDVTVRLTAFIRPNVSEEGLTC